MKGLGGYTWYFLHVFSVFWSPMWPVNSEYGNASGTLNHIENLFFRNAILIFFCFKCIWKLTNLYWLMHIIWLMLLSYNHLKLNKINLILKIMEKKSLTFDFFSVKNFSLWSLLVSSLGQRSCLSGVVCWCIQEEKRRKKRRQNRNPKI
jgi:hypothetical protein